MNHTKIFHNTWGLQQLPVTMTLSSVEWRFLLCCDGKTSVQQIQKRLALSDKEQTTTLARLIESGLLTETVQTLEDYARTTIDHPSTVTGSQTLNEYLRSSLPAESVTEKGKDKEIPTFSPLPKPTANSTRSMSLQSVIQFILNHHSDPTAGQLATYQVFMGIKTDLLKRNGITSLRFQDDRLITDPELQTAITENIQKILKVPCPDDVFATPSPAARK